MRHLFRFLLSERVRSDDPAAILSGPKRGRSLPKILTIADVDRLLARAKMDADLQTSHLPSDCARRGFIACWKCYMPPVSAYLNWSRYRCRRRGAMPA